ncbi:MAG: hypothetical protein K8E66_01455 [Phycisphaerales bacterium]|nr:hypothetical protein [Phycisphaerales bacterium]
MIAGSPIQVMTLARVHIPSGFPAESPADAQAGRGALDEAFSLVQALPIEAHVSMGLMLLAGLALWLFGGKLIKPIFAVIGVALGGIVGLIVLPALGLEEVGGASGSLVGLGVGAVIGLILALVTLRVAIVFAAGLGLASAGFLGGTVYLEHNPLPDDTPPAFVIDDEAARDDSGRRLFPNPYTGESMTLERLTRTLREVDSYLKGGSDDAETSPEDQPGRERFTAIAVQCRAVLMEAYDTAKNHWNALSVRERLVVLGSTLGSMAFGMMVGFIMPKKSSAAITALAGSAIWLTAAVWLADAFLPGMRSFTTQPPETWAIVWGLVFLIGVVVQLAGLGRTSEGKPKPKKKQDDDEDEGDEDEA